MAVTSRASSYCEGFNSLLRNLKYEHLVAGISGGLVATLVLHPLDLVKIRFAVNDGKEHLGPKYRSIANAFTTIYKQEGLYGMYRGVIPNIWGAGSSWGFYFFFYNSIKTSMSQSSTDALGPTQHLLAASEAGALTLVLTNPVWVIKTRLCLQYSSTEATRINLYTGMFDAIRKIYRAEGVRAFYKGFVPGLFGVSHGAVQFMVYEDLKTRWNSYKRVSTSDKLGTVEYLTFAAVSKLIAAVATYPYQVVRLRLQSQEKIYRTSLECIAKTWRFEGWRGFYKGLASNLLRVTPATMITFVTYENISHFLTKWRD